MRKFLSILSVLLVISTAWLSISAAWVTGVRKTASEIQVNDTIVLAAASTEAAVGHYLQGTQIITQLTNDCPFVVVAGPTSANGVDPTIYLKQVTTGKYLGYSSLTEDEGATVAMVDELDKAFNFSIYTGDSAAINESYPPVLSPEQEVVFRFVDGNVTNVIGALYLANWWGNTGEVPVWEYNDTAPWEVLTAHEVHDASMDLQAIIDSYDAEGIDFVGGTNPGCYDIAAAAAYQTALQNARIYVQENHTDDEFKAVSAELEAAHAAVAGTMVPISDGYYYIVNAYTEYFKTQEVYKAMYANTNSQLCWATIDSTSASYVFKISKLATDGQYSVQNLKTSQFINTVAGTSAEVPMSNTQTTAQTFTSIGSAQFNIANTANSQAYHTNGHGGGSGTGSTIVTWNSGVNSASAWYLQKIDDSVIEAMQSALVKERILENLESLIIESNGTYDQTFTYAVQNGEEDAMIVNASDEVNDALQPIGQISSNAKEATEGSYAALIDNDGSTFFHSTWHASDDPGEDHYLQIDLSNAPAQNFAIYWKRRMSNNNNRPTDVTIAVSNDTTGGGTWKEVKHIATGLPTEANDSTYTSAGIDCGAPYKYVRFTVHNTNNGAKTGDHVFFTFSEFQLYPFAIDTKLSQYYAVEGMKDACDALKAQVAAAQTKLNDKTATAEDVEALQNSLDAVKALFGDSTEYVALRNKAQSYVDNAEIGTEIGYVSSDSYITTLQTTINEVNGGINFEVPNKVQLDAAIATLNTAIETFMAGINTIEPNKWYYIISSSPREYAQGQAIYANNASVGATARFGMYNSEKDEVMYSSNPYAMWRFVPTEVKGQYTVQNLATAHNLGAYNGVSGEITMTNKQDLYSVEYYNAGQMSITSLDAANTDNVPLHAQSNGMLVVSWWAETENNGSAWTFKEVDQTELEEFAFDVINNTMSVMTLPYALTSDNALSNFNDAKTYTVKSITNDGTTTSIELTEKNEFAAGEPFILAMGDYASYNAEALDTIQLFCKPVFDITTEAQTVNGLVGTLDGITLSKSGFGYFNDAALNLTTSAACTIAGGTGYFEPSSEVGTGATDLTITLNGIINSIKPLAPTTSENAVNVYSIGGQLVKKNVKASDAAAGLEKGIYIMGKKKISVK